MEKNKNEKKLKQYFLLIDFLFYINLKMMRLI